MKRTLLNTTLYLVAFVAIQVLITLVIGAIAPIFGQKSDSGLMLVISSAGFPVAISRLVAHSKGNRICQKPSLGHISMVLTGCSRSYNPLISLTGINAGSP